MLLTSMELFWMTRSGSYREAQTPVRFVYNQRLPIYWFFTEYTLYVTL